MTYSRPRYNRVPIPDLKDNGNVWKNLGLIQQGIPWPSDTVDVRDFGVVPNSPADQSALVQSAYDTVGAGTYYFPAGTYVFNAVVPTGSATVGAGRKATIFSPATDAPVFSVAGGTYVSGLAFRDFKIAGDLTKTAQDGIYLTATGTGNAVDRVLVAEVEIANCGRHGIYAYGTSNAGPHVQNLLVLHCYVTGCNQSGIRIEGANFEHNVIGSFFTLNGGATGTYPNAEVIYDQSGTSTPYRINFLGCVFSNKAARDAGYAATGLSIDSLIMGTITGCDFENADPHLTIQGTQAASRAISIRACMFTDGHNATAYVNLGSFVASSLKNCQCIAAGGTVTNFILNTTGVSNLAQSEIEKNQYSVSGLGALSGTPISFVLTETIASGVAYYDHDLLFLATEGGTGTDTLDTLNARYSASVVGEPGATVTLVLAHPGTQTITISHGTGNLFLRLETDFVLSNNSTITFRMVGSTWTEVGRMLDGAIQTYTTTNSTSRTFNSSTVTTAQLGDVVGTLIADLRAQNFVL